MHYLRCNNCGHFNEVKTEYLTFCSKCNKKLNNSYGEWRKTMLVEHIMVLSLVYKFQLLMMQR